MSAPQLTNYINGQGSVSGDQLNTFVQTAQNVTQLRNFTGAPGQAVQLQGQTTAGDGYGGFFYWNPAGTEPDDGINYIQPYGSTGQWWRITVNDEFTIPPIYTAADFGIDGGSQDSTRLQSALSFVAEQHIGKISLENLDSTISIGSTISYLGEGVLPIEGVYIEGPAYIDLTGTMTLFTIEADSEGQQNGLAKFSDFGLQGDGTGLQSAFSVINLSNVLIEDIYALDVGPVVSATLAQGLRVRDVKAFGNGNTGAVAIGLTHCLESFIVDSHAYNYGTGFLLQGSLSVGIDGDMRIHNAIANQHSGYAYRLIGAYTPFVTNISCESSGVGLSVESSQSGFYNNLYMGPQASATAYGLQTVLNSGGSGNNNNYNIFNNINGQNQWSVQHMFFSIMDNVILSQLPTSGITNGASFVSSAANVLSNWLMQSNSGLTHSLNFDANSSAWISGGYYGNGIYLAGTYNGTVGSGGRTGGTIIGLPVINGVSSQDGRYISQPAAGQLAEGGMWWNPTTNRIEEISLGYQLPYVAASGTISAGVGHTATFDVAPLLQIPATQINATIAEFVVAGGSPGSTSAYVFKAVKSQDAAAAAVSYAAVASGSLTCSASGSVITLTNSSGAVVCPYQITMVELATY